MGNLQSPAEKARPLRSAPATTSPRPLPAGLLSRDAAHSSVHGPRPAVEKVAGASAMPSCAEAAAVPQATSASMLAAHRSKAPTSRETVPQDGKVALAAGTPSASQSRSGGGEAAVASNAPLAWGLAVKEEAELQGVRVAQEAAPALAPRLLAARTESFFAEQEKSLRLQCRPVTAEEAATAQLGVKVKLEDSEVDGAPLQMTPECEPAATEQDEMKETRAMVSQEESPQLLQQVTQIFAALESKSTPATTALARLRELSKGSPEAFPEVIGQCIDKVLACTGPHLDIGVLDSALDVIVAACNGVRACDGTSLVIYTLCLLVCRLGDKDGARAPRNKFARCYGARLLGRLLPVAQTVMEEWPADLLESCEGVLTRLASDRAPAVRLAAVPGLVSLQTAGAHRALVRLSVVDTTAPIRVAALKAVARSSGSHSLDEAQLPLSRCLDSAPAVRRCLYAALAGQRAWNEDDCDDHDGAASLANLSSETFMYLLRHGLEDVSASVRAAAEELLCAWLQQRKRGDNSPLLELLSLLDVEANEMLAEKVINCLALRVEWRESLEGIARKPLADYDDFRNERALLWRKMVMRAEQGTTRYFAEFGVEATATQVECGLHRSHVFEMRQLLLSLAAAGRHVHGSCCRNSSGGCRLFEMAMSVLLRAPLNFDVVPTRPSVTCLALVLIQNALKSCSNVGGELPKTGPTDERFLDVVSHALRALRVPAPNCRAVASNYTAVGPSAGPSEVVDQEGLNVLGDRFDSLLGQRSSAENNAAKDEELVQTSARLALLTRRALGIAEEALGLLSTSHADDSLALLEDLPTVLFRPTLVRADSAESAVDLQLSSWPALRAIAVRCLALHTSLCPELTASHWPFFVVVLKRYSPLVVGAVDGPTSAIVEACVNFLVDTQLVHRRMTDPEELDKRAIELFEAVAGLLGLSARQMQLPPAFRRCLTDRLCMLLLFGGVWSLDPYRSGVGSAADRPNMPAGALDTIPLPARWVLTGLLVESFYRSPPVVGSMGRTELALNELSQEASQRGCLLQFFSSLSDLSGMHATLLAAACEGLLATDLWRLAVPAQLGCGRRWRALQLPRLLRLLSRHLVVAAGAQGAQGTPTMMVNVWLECMWRPLALVCLETKQEDSQLRQLLAEALLATLAAIEVAGESRTPFATAPEWPAAVAEVAHALALIMASWGWRSQRSSKRCAERDAASGDRRSSKGGADVPRLSQAGECRLSQGEPTKAAAAAAQSMENAKTPLLKLAARFTASVTHNLSDAVERWPHVQALAKKRCEMLRRAFAELGVDTGTIVDAATEAARVRPSQAFFSCDGRKAARPQRQKNCRRLSKMVKKRRKKDVPSDDDSEGPPPSAQNPRCGDPSDPIEASTQEDVRVSKSAKVQERKVKKIKIEAKVEIIDPVQQAKEIEEMKARRRALALGF